MEGLVFYRCSKHGVQHPSGVPCPTCEKEKKEVEIMDSTGVLEALCKATGRWGMYFKIFIPDSCPTDRSYDEVPEAASFLNFEDHTQVIADGEGWLLCGSEEELQRRFESCVGDDGPTPLNPYNGKVRVYALTCDDQGQCRNENT